jgi:hypothetical protein
VLTTRHSARAIARIAGIGLAGPKQLEQATQCALGHAGHAAVDVVHVEAPETSSSSSFAAIEAFEVACDTLAESRDRPVLISSRGDTASLAIVLERP